MAQENGKRNIAYVEFLGAAIGPSVNYERQIFPATDLMVRAGVGYFQAMSD